MEIISETAVPLLRCWACFRDYTKLPLWGILLSDVKILYKINFWFMGLINWEEWNMSRLGGWDKSLKFKGVFSTNCFHLIEDLWLSFIEPPDYNSWLYATATEQDYATASAVQIAKLNKNNSNILMEPKSFLDASTLKLCLFSSQLSLSLWHFCICKMFRIGLVQLHHTSEYHVNLDNILKFSCSKSKHFPCYSIQWTKYKPDVGNDTFKTGSKFS